MKNTKTKYYGHKGTTNAKHESHMKSKQEELTQLIKLIIDFLKVIAIIQHSLIMQIKTINSFHDNRGQ